MKRFSKKSALTVLLAGMAAAAVIMLTALWSTVRSRKIRADNVPDRLPELTAAVTEVTEVTEEEVGYYLKEYEGELAVFRGDSSTPYRKLGTPLNFMTQEDKNILKQGIYVRTERELKRLIEDYTS